MLKFFYDSLETVKKLKHPTTNEFVNITIAIFAFVLISGFVFILFDTFFSEVYRYFYNLVSGIIA